MELVDHTKPLIEDKEFVADVIEEDLSQKSFNRVFALKKFSQMLASNSLRFPTATSETVGLFVATLPVQILLDQISEAHSTKNASFIIQLGNIRY